jgi:hypothetical protein
MKQCRTRWSRNRRSFRLHESIDLHDARHSYAIVGRVAKID